MRQITLFLLLLLELLVQPVFPQASTGTISGTVTDQTGAVVIAAPVVLTNIAADTVVRGSTNETGFYLFPGLIPGNYRLDIEVPGMQKYEATVTLNVQTSTVVNVALKVGTAATTISVNDVTSLLTVDQGKLSEVIDRNRIEQLPINGRNVTNLLFVVPGNNGQRAFGERFGAQDMILDGVTMTNTYWGTQASSRQPGLDTIQEMNVVNNGASAEYSLPTTIVLATKSGTNGLHGSAFETNRNSGYGVARQRQSTWSKPPFLNRNEFGVSAGGPFILPHVYNGKNKTFWFFGYEGMRQVQPSFAGASVPTQAMRNGDFSGLVDAQGRRETIYNPWSTGADWSRQPFPNNVIPSSQESPLAKYLLGLTPLPTTADNPMVTSNWWGQWPYWTKNYTISARLDHQFSERDRLYATFTYRPYDQYVDQYSFPTSNLDIGGYFTSDPAQSYAVNYLHLFSPTLNNNVMLSVGRDHWIDGCGSQANYGTLLGLPNPFNSVCWFNLPATELPGDFYDNSTGNYGQWMTHAILDDNAVKLVGKHEIKFGFHTRYDQDNIFAGMDSPPSMNPSTGATSLYDPTSSRTAPLATPYTGSLLANEYLGVMNFTAPFQQTWFYDRLHQYALYVQDNFRVTQRLTLNLGLRWEYYSPVMEKHNQLSGFDIPNHAVIIGDSIQQKETLGNTTPAIIALEQSLGVKFETNQQAGWPTSLMTSQKDQFAPRLGFAYRAGDGAKSFVLRGGYSISYFPVNTRTMNQGAEYNMPSYGYFQYNLTSASLSPDGISNYGMRSVPTVIAGLNSSNAISLTNPGGITAGSGSLQSTFPGTPDQSNPRIQQWNVTWEKEVAKETIVRVVYQGSHTTRILQVHTLNSQPPSNVWYVSTGQPIPTGVASALYGRPYDSTTYGTLSPYYPTGYMNEDGMQFILERRYRKGFSYQIFYTVTNAFGDVGAQNSSQWIGGDNTIPAANQYLPGTVPQDDMARDRLLNYKRDTSIPKHEVRWNFLVDLPFGKGKPVLGNAGRVLNQLVGGWQLAGTGTLTSRYFSLPTSIWPNGNPVQVYGKKYKIQDCTSGVCYPAYLYFNGYLPADLINSHNAAGQPNGYEGVPADYKPAATPLIPWGSTALPANAPANTNISAYWDTNTIWVPLQNGTVQRTTTPVLNPWINQYMLGPFIWSQDASLFKRFPIKERYQVRFNLDAFNVFNHPGIVSSVASTGLLSLRNSSNAARVLQLTLRFSW